MVAYWQCAPTTGNTPHTNNTQHRDRECDISRPQERARQLPQRKASFHNGVTCKESVLDTTTSLSCMYLSRGMRLLVSVRGNGVSHAC